MTDFDAIGTDAWFDGNIQKIVSVAAGLATAEFNRLRLVRSMTEKEDMSIPYNAEFYTKFKMATFDARVFTIPSKTEVGNMIVWRQKDATRNSISSVARSLYKQKEVDGKNSDQKQEMIFQKGINWNDYPAKQKRGRLIIKETVEMKTDVWKPYVKEATNYFRTIWKSVECPIFTQDMEFLYNLIPDMS